ncbi:tRNA (adenosine(37)-N6)-dimethylallyltransferase MiaA [Candidatus Wolfebacteria bacterium CG02_land_8_20_14_3_00_37_12]|uniref:tRNA dimethylallyltransferase n=2 Tax=Candidatus Wolfeibacteriota TaxID=1752735 RepID=A0A2M7CQ48_9BACT|nr:MAG: tRNA (adenosine(37)-N6)-dimethylallyltransferase MiaA [Candidatus Wolfebacteria bacterium CG02_land_8_20_14_3_00_37_12]
MSIPYKLIVILGPTASGKSNLAVKIARKIDGEIISADSRQVYKGLNIGSGKITKKEMRGIPHYLLNVASPKRTFTVTQYQKLAKKTLINIIKRDKIPIICGGTGLYIDALIYDYQFPQVPPQPKLRKQLEKKSTEKLFEQLKKLDPRRATNIDKNNRRRLIRALEICISTGKPTPSLNDIRVNPLLSFGNPRQSASILKIGIKKSPEELKYLIKKRLIKRLNGIIKEVKNLHYNQKLSWQRLDDLGLEYRYVSRYLRGLINKKEMVESLEKEIYRYAKRQMTWFKKDEKIHWIDNDGEARKLTQQFLK